MNAYPPPRIAGSGITESDLLVINKSDIAEQVHSSLDVMDRDVKIMRGKRPLVFTIYCGVGLEKITSFILKCGT
ncbi:GTP-binding protein [Marinobacter salarius]|uniref:GTP-binding protein n=1 Tax=Marinobacter salarius TaxID=1420917 RepID=UPI0039C8D47A